MVIEPWFLDDEEDVASFENSIANNEEPTVVTRLIPPEEWDADGDNYVDCTPTDSLLLWESSQKQVIHESGLIYGLVGGDDCDDERDYVYPFAPEICNGQHDDCEEQLTVGGIPDNEIDNDGDTHVPCIPTGDITEWFGEEESIIVYEDGSFSIKGADCNDADPNFYVGAAVNRPDVCAQDANGDGYPDCALAGVHFDYRCDFSHFYDSDVGADFIVIEQEQLQDPKGRYIIPHKYYMMTTEVTQEMFEAWMGYNPSVNVGTDLPVENINWHEAVAFSNALSAQIGLEECYDCTGTQTSVLCTEAMNLDLCTGYRLPSASQWELAARSGTTGSFWTGEGEQLGGSADGQTCYGTEFITDNENNPPVDNFGWFCGNSNGSTQVIAQKQPNDFGLYDMHSNVNEWLSDYSSCSYTDTKGSVCDIYNTYKYSVGGTFDQGPLYMRVDLRDTKAMYARFDYKGIASRESYRKMWISMVRIHRLIAMITMIQ